MRHHQNSRGSAAILGSYVVSLTLQLIPWPTPIGPLAPTWPLLVLAYWTLALPERVGIGHAMVLGITWDLTLGLPLGIRSMALVLLSYALVCYCQPIRNMALRQQALVIAILSLAAQLLIHCAQKTLSLPSSTIASLWGSLTNGLLWPWLFSMLRKIRRRLDLH